MEKAPYISAKMGDGALLIMMKIVREDICTENVERMWRIN